MGQSRNSISHVNGGRSSAGRTPRRHVGEVRSYHGAVVQWENVPMSRREGQELLWGCSSVGERLTGSQKVTGSNPVSSTTRY